MYLLDTAVVWELRGAKAGRGDARVAGWAAAQPITTLFVSALTIAELAAAAVQMDRSDKAGSAAVRRWIEKQLPVAFDGRVLPVDMAVARRAGSLGYADMRDALIAGSALEHGLTLATRRPAAFRAGRVKSFDPWGYAPDMADADLDWREAPRSGPIWLRNLFVRG